MSDADRDAQQINAIAAMTASEVQAGLRQFGLRPIEHLPPELSRLSATEQWRSGELIKVIEVREETQDVMTVAPNRDVEFKNLRDNAAWAVIRRQFQLLKTLQGTLAFRRVAGVSILALVIVISITFGVRAVFNFFDERRFAGFYFVNFQSDEEMRLREAMALKFTPRCTEAFTSAALRSPLEVAAEGGVELRPARDLYLYSAEDLGLAYEQTRQAYREGFSSGRAQSGAVPSMRNGVRLTTDGRSRIFMHDSAFEGNSFWFGRLSLNDVLTHEFIHLGGQLPTLGWLGPFQHDLAGFEHYDEIMGACR